MVTAFGVFSDDLVSYTVGTETAKQGMITPPEDSTPVALHGTVDDFAHDLEFI
jgi:hypothetical protein